MPAGSLFDLSQFLDAQPVLNGYLRALLRLGAAAFPHHWVVHRAEGRVAAAEWTNGWLPGYGAERSPP